MAGWNRLRKLIFGDAADRSNGRSALIVRIELPNGLILFREPFTLPNEWLANRTGRSRLRSRIDELTSGV